MPTTCGGGAGIDTLILGQEFNSTAVTEVRLAQVLATLTAGSFERFLSEGDIQLIASAQNDVISLTDFDGFTARRAIQLLAGNDRFTSSLGGSWVEGGAGNDTLIGLSGQDSFVGGLGEDSMNGGDGGDIYTVDAVDRVVDSGATGRDAIIAMGGTYVLPNSIEDLLAGGGNIVGNGNYKANYMSGGLGKDALSGLAGADTLNGSRGDTLLGGTGDDTYVLNATVVQVVEAAGAGRDAVQTNLSSATLADNVEILRHLGTFAFVGTGNDAANLIQSGDGADTLRGLGGDDTLVGGGGANRLAGGTGDDTYVVTEATDVIVELDGQGRDTVNTGLMTYVLPDFVENLQMTGNFTGLGSSATGNALDNTITGGASAENLNGLDGNDFLSGMAGFDTLIGGLGNDTYRIDDDGNEQDLVIEAALGGTDTILLKRFQLLLNRRGFPGGLVCDSSCSGGSRNAQTLVCRYSRPLPEAF